MLDSDFDEGCSSPIPIHRRRNPPTPFVSLGKIIGYKLAGVVIKTVDMVNGMVNRKSQSNDMEQQPDQEKMKQEATDSHLEPSETANNSTHQQPSSASVRNSNFNTTIINLIQPADMLTTDTYNINVNAGQRSSESAPNHNVNHTHETGTRQSRSYKTSAWNKDSRKKTVTRKTGRGSSTNIKADDSKRQKQDEDNFSKRSDQLNRTSPEGPTINLHEDYKNDLETPLDNDGQVPSTSQTTIDTRNLRKKVVRKEALEPQSLEKGEIICTEISHKNQDGSTIKGKRAKKKPKDLSLLQPLNEIEKHSCTDNETGLVKLSKENMETHLLEQTFSTKETTAKRGHFSKVLKSKEKFNSSNKAKSSPRRVKHCSPKSLKTEKERVSLEHKINDRSFERLKLTPQNSQCATPNPKISENKRQTIPPLRDVKEEIQEESCSRTWAAVAKGAEHITGTANAPISVEENVWGLPKDTKQSKSSDDLVDFPSLEETRKGNRKKEKHWLNNSEDMTSYNLRGCKANYARSKKLQQNNHQPSVNKKVLITKAKTKNCKIMRGKRMKHKTDSAEDQRGSREQPNSDSPCTSTWYIDDMPEVVTQPVSPVFSLREFSGSSKADICNMFGSITVNSNIETTSRSTLTNPKRNREVETKGKSPKHKGTTNEEIGTQSKKISTRYRALLRRDYDRVDMKKATEMLNRDRLMPDHQKDKRDDRFKYQQKRRRDVRQHNAQRSRADAGYTSNDPEEGTSRPESLLRTCLRSYLAVCNEDSTSTSSSSSDSTLQNDCPTM